MDDDQQFCLRWNNHQSTLISVFDTLLENETLVDCTLAAEGKFLKAHKVVLSACSPYFATLLQEQYDKHPIFILKDVKYQELRAMMDYMYRGEVNISQDQLAALLKAAESLQIKGLSDNRSGGGTTAPKPEHHRATMPTGKLSAGYTLEQTKRARIAGPAEPEMGSREGSSSPSRRRRKVRRRSIENAMTDVHDNSNSSQQQTQSNASGLGAITAAASALAAAAAAAPNTQSLASNVPLSASTSSSTAVTAPGTTLSSSKKTDIVKGTTQQQQQTQQDAMNTDNVQGPASAATATGSIDTETTDSAAAVASTATDKSNHKQLQQQLKQAKESISGNAAAGSGSELVIEPKAEYDDEANDEPVEDLTLDEEDMGMDDLDQNAGTSQGGEGSSQGYAPWQHDRSQDELLLATQEAQQRDPQDNLQNDAINQGLTTNTTTSASAQQESRIRVRNWLMLADQSILEKNYNDGSSGEQQLTKNNNNTLITSNSNATNNNNNNNTTTTTGLVVNPSTNAVNATTTNTNLNLTTQNTPTIQRIGSIGRTTITCITPAGGDATATNPQAALAAAGVELDAVDDNNSMTEVVVKIENSATSSQDEDEEMPDEGDDAPTTETNEEDEETDMNYDDIKLSSPMMWAIDSVKIEQEEEFEDILTAGFDNTTTSLDNDDEFLQTVPSVTMGNMSGDMDMQKNRVLVAKKRVSLETLKSLNKHPGKNQSYVTQIELQDPQELLEKHQHFQKLRLQPNQPVQIKLRSIPATITSIQPKMAGSVAPPLAPLSTLKAGGMSDMKPGSSNSNVEFKSTISEDRRYRMITQNQRTRKESLEHSEDMIYNADIEKPWVCRNCNRNYKWKNSLKCHLKNECGQPPRYFCSKLCGYATNVHSNLKRHMNTKCRERTEEDNQMLLQQVQVQQPQLVHQTKSLTNTTNTNATITTTSNCGNINTISAAGTLLPTATNNNGITGITSSNNNNNNNNNTTTSTTSTYTLVFQKSE
ncbi:longitudinals lacking protein, isoforms J/P/Q/S/Z isoform X2 [Lucilia cuprina]|uniref:longitudinals lacking protein, isoforms J/P/Q/S/Z isoform X2 n=1 Tax=Lucilia cuprina TaxID=7375 RepID=UPI001F05D0A4|nr:longitudinals lacking protein, isoforms J/P/Q/S/Z isoform X2 [Lucilia cuprina]